MVELLNNKGFKEQKRCSCGGSTLITFIKNASPVMIKIRPSRMYYEFYLSGKLVDKGNQDFENKLNQYAQ